MKELLILVLISGCQLFQTKRESVNISNYSCTFTRACDMNCSMIVNLPEYPGEVTVDDFKFTIDESFRTCFTVKSPSCQNKWCEELPYLN
jgi:hypothetical protein